MRKKSTNFDTKLTTQQKKRTAYESVLSKQSKNTKSDNKIEQELAKSKDAFRSVNLEYVMKLNEYQKKKDFFLVERLTDIFYSMRSMHGSVDKALMDGEEKVNWLLEESKKAKRDLEEEMKSENYKKNLIEKNGNAALEKNNMVEGYLFKKVGIFTRWIFIH